MLSLKWISNLLTGLSRFLILHYIAASTIAFTFAIVNLTRAFMAANLLVCLIDMDSVYFYYSKFNQNIYCCPVPCIITNCQAWKQDFHWSWSQHQISVTSTPSSMSGLDQEPSRCVAYYSEWSLMRQRAPAQRYVTRSASLKPHFTVTTMTQPHWLQSLYLY